MHFYKTLSSTNHHNMYTNSPYILNASINKDGVIKASIFDEFDTILSS